MSIVRGDRFGGFNIVERNEDSQGCYGVVFDMLPEIEAVHLAPFTGFQMFYGEPEKRAVSFMQVQGIEKMREYILSKLLIFLNKIDLQ